LSQPEGEDVQKFLRGWEAYGSDGKLYPVSFSYVSAAPDKSDPLGRDEVFGYYYDDPVNQETGRIFIRRTRA
jgi:hypothetical protein